MLFPYLIKYITYNAYGFKETYTISIDTKQKCINNICDSKTYKQLHENINLCIREKFCSMGCFYILIIFCQYVEKYSDKENIDEFVVLKFLFIYTSDKSVSTSNTYRKILVRFVNNYNYEYSLDIDKVSISSYKFISPTYLSPHYFLSLEEVRYFLCKTKQYPHKDSVRDIFIIELLLRTGIRVSELIHIRKKDLYIEDSLCFVSIKGKNNLFRVVAISLEKHKDKIDNLLTRNGKKDSWLFKKKDGTQLNRQYVYYLIKKMLEFAQIFKLKKGPHLLRHTFATHLYNKEKDLILVQEALGHQSLQSTTRYVHVNMEKMKTVLNLYD